MGDTLGPFTLRGILRWEHDRKILLAKETTLERLVWIALRSRGAAPPSKTRQNLARAARPRWLTGGESAQWRWDAYLAPTGCSLADLAGNNGLPWTEVRPILEDLVEELDVASRDGTLPEVLSVDEVWVQPDGRVLLIDPLAPASEHAPEQDGTCRIFDLTLRVTAVSLEGYHKRDDTAVRAIHAPVPRHVAEIFDRLLGQGPSFTSAEELLSALHAGQSLPTEINRARRSAHLILQSALLLPGVIAMFWAAHAWRIGLLASLPTHLQTSMAFMPLLWPLLWIVWALLTHGGLTMRLSGMALVRCDNRPASRGLCGVRAALVWLPISAILTASMFAPMLAPSFPLLGMLIWSTALGLVMIGPILALLSPSRGLHDRILGTALVPA